ncbi:MAG: DUF1549 domain-containing protein [Pirellulaceae bacterium]
MPKSISVAPAESLLRGSRARQQLLVSGDFANARMADLTRTTTYESSNPKVATISQSGLVTPLSDGTAEIKASIQNLSAVATVKVSGMAEPAITDFRTDAIAALSRAGCSQGACHGSPQGKNGFRLSLRGYDPDVDLQFLTRESPGRRTNPQEPDTSLILLKGSGRVPHQGGVRFKPTDVAYQTLRSWIVGGCKDAKPGRQLVTLETIPSQRLLPASHPQQQVIALARFADGTVEDVSSLAVFTTRNDPDYSVSTEGLVSFNKTAEATILVRYLEQVRSVRLTYVQEDPTYEFRGPEPVNGVDRHIFAQQKLLQLQPATQAGDGAFLRRVYLDVIGALPTEAEAREYLDSAAPDKRARLIDRLLEREEYANFWALKWADVMRGNRTTISQRGVHSFHRYLVNHFSQDRPFDQLVREILAAQGNTLHKPAANFYRISPTPDEAAENFAQLFLGIRMQCAKCHNHPFESLTQTDYYGLAAYFARVKIKGKQFALDDEIIYLDRQGEVQHPLTRKNLEPVVLGVAAGTLTPEDDRRARLADWLTSPDNRYFARSTVNRIWYHLMGKGIVEPVDDFRDTNPPSHPELLGELAQEFVRGGFRVRPVLRMILNSRTYQLSAEKVAKQSPQASNPSRYFTQATVRMLTAEQIVDAVSSAIGVPEEFRGYPRGTKAVELAEGEVENHFLMAFTRPIRDAACDCAREDDPSLNEVLHLLNNADLVKRIASKESCLAGWLAAGKTTPQIVESMYLATLSRRPTPAEIKLIDEHLALHADRERGLQDLQHALINSNEFLLRH